MPPAPTSTASLTVTLPNSPSPTRVLRLLQLRTYTEDTSSPKDHSWQ